MTDNPLDRIPTFDRVSIRAVVVCEGEDATQALSEAGIFDPIAFPLVIGEDPPDVGFGDGITPNLTAVLEFDQEDDEFGASTEPAPVQATPAQRGPATGRRAQQTQPATTLPAAYGTQSLAPVRPARRLSGLHRKV